MNPQYNAISETELSALWDYHSGEYALWVRTGIAPIKIVGGELLPEWSEGEYWQVREAVAERLPELLDAGVSYER